MTAIKLLALLLFFMAVSGGEAGDVDGDDLGASELMSQRVYLLATLKIKPEFVADFLPKMMNNAKGARKMGGNLRFDVFRDPKEENVFVLIEEYTDMAAFQAQQKSEHAQPCISMFQTWIASPPEVRFLKPENVGNQ